ncbi:hypothetical protein [Microbacterium pygmaeum]|uniref:Uncharacterized protein n=1 Tax=Microbacterium pygmaeum TaxID=370764 RepID=A0A1G7ZSZ7_9MICO|nr:hypothetical protein [Microbacterium pygmaeum]SDH11676.1 hypothetical protein SAMN04489810_2153 [Microbacterium pygmaeum]
MNAEEQTRAAAGEGDTLPPAPKNPGLPEAEAVRKDISYSPASETETEQKQQNPLPDTVDDDIDPDDVRVVPGTGGPDDVGEVDVDPDELNMPGRG